MMTRLAAVMRVLQRLLALLAGLLLLLVVAASLSRHPARTGKSLPLLRAMTAKVGTLIAGQRTEHVKLDVRVVPSEARLGASATLTVRGTAAPRQLFYFLLNGGLHARNLHVDGM